MTSGIGVGMTWVCSVEVERNRASHVPYVKQVELIPVTIKVV